MVFHRLVSKILAGTDQNGTFFDNNCAIQAEMVVELELALIEKKQSRRFRHARKLRKGSKVLFQTVKRTKLQGGGVGIRRCIKEHPAHAPDYITIITIFTSIRIEPLIII